MKGPAIDCPFWSRGRFLAVVGALFIVQVGLILLFSDRSLAVAPSSAPSVRFRALGAVSEDQLWGQFFVGDPAVFPLPNSHGFSGRGWLDQEPPAYKAEMSLEPPIWLNLDTARLGTNFPVLASVFDSMLSGLAKQKIRREEPLPVFLVPAVIPTQSVFRLEGGLNDRLLGAPSLRSWPSEKLLKKSVVQIAVDPMGEVVAVKLDASSDSAEADAEALSLARALRFRPSMSAGTQWCNAIFLWQTSEPAGSGPQK